MPSAGTGRRNAANATDLGICRPNVTMCKSGGGKTMKPVTGRALEMWPSARICKQKNTASLMKIEVYMNSKPVSFVLDSGAEVNIIDDGTYTNIGSPQIRNCKEKGTMFDGTQKSFIGKGSGTFEFNGAMVDHDFYVARKGALNILSVQTMDAFGLLDGIKRKIN